MSGGRGGSAVSDGVQQVPCRTSAHRSSACGAGTCGSRVRGSDRAQQGSVTAEVAVVLPALVLLLALLLGTAHVGTVQLRLEEAARAGAREVMRGESNASVEQTVQRLAGRGASARVVSGSGWATVEVRSRVEGPFVELMGIELHASASGREEHHG
ncbi:TadE family type IV pilus minor pilin [Arthrobacter sp. MDT2-16]